MNFDELIYRLMSEDLPGVHCQPGYERGQVSRLPAVIWQVTAAPPVRNFDRSPISWRAVLGVNVIAMDMDAAQDLATRVDRVVWGWGEPFSGRGHRFPDIGHVAEVSGDAFTRVKNPNVQGAEIVQFSALFRMTMTAPRK